MTVEHSTQTDLHIERLTMQSIAECADRLALSPGEVQVWGCSLDVSADVLKQCRQWLSPLEQERADRFRFDLDRERFILAHGWLRYRLSRYCGTAPEALDFDKTPEGKPFLLSPNGQSSGLRFNLSHSHGHALVAVADGIEVGADLEEIRQDVEHLKLAERFFSPNECGTISAMEGAAQRAAFFRYWAGKEAVLKATGIGLRLPLDRCVILFAADGRASVRWQDESESTRDWIVRYLPVGPHWAGAVAAEGHEWRLTLCR